MSTLPRISLSLAAAALTATVAACATPTPQAPAPATSAPATTAPASTPPSTPDTTATPTSTATASASASATATSSASASASSSASPAAADKGAPLENALAAIQTAEQAAGGGRAIEADHSDNGGWQVDVVKDGKKTEVQVSDDGKTVTKTGEAQTMDSGDRRQAEQAQSTLADALRIALQRHPGTLDEAELTTHKDKVAYEIEVYSRGAEKLNVYVDAASGAYIEAAKG